MRKLVSTVSAVLLGAAVSLGALYYYSVSKGIVYTPENPEVSARALDYLVSDEEYERCIMGYEDPELTYMPEKDIKKIMLEYYDKDYRKGYKKETGREFKDDFMEYAKVAYVVTGCRYKIATVGYEQTSQDFALYSSELKTTRDMIEKRVDRNLIYDFKNSGYSSMDWLQKAKFIQDVRNQKRGEAEKELNEERISNPSVITEITKNNGGEKATLLDDFKEKNRVEELLSKENKMLPINKEFLDNVGEFQTAIYTSKLPKEPVSPQELEEILKSGAEGIVKIHSNFNVNEIAYNSGGFPAEGDYDTMNIRGFEFINYFSGVAYRISNTVDNKWIVVETKFIPDLIDFYDLREIKDEFN